MSRFSSSWAAGKPNVSATMVSTVTLFLAGCAVCIMPYWSSLIGQIILMAAFGLAISPFFSLTSIILCDILDLEALTNAYGIVTLVRGIASTVGSPVAGTIVSATSTFSIAFLLSGATVLIGGFLYIAIILHERAKLNKLIADADSDHGK
ncbi:unnamed protein product [Mesocestoides corti]|uniref:Major facilitator superfamily (MFS) profile domain-containing protein n=1 Tax=Mesocestoides corti TaxID=53468 RepID=A0A3P6HWZ2_MESCO|nr:unnamed protein product [Mesocestoides corti]